MPSPPLLQGIPGGMGTTGRRGLPRERSGKVRIVGGQIFLELGKAPLLLC